MGLWACETLTKWLHKEGKKNRKQLKQLNVFSFFLSHNSLLKEFFFALALWAFLGIIQALMALTQLSVSVYGKSFESYFQLKKWQVFFGKCRDLHLKMKWTPFPLDNAGRLNLNQQESRGEQLLSNPVSAVQ